MEMRKKIRVVLADDHPMVRRGVRKILEKSPNIAVVGEAGTGTAALRLVQELKPDVLLLDIEMPKMKGDQVARELRKINFPVSILVLSGCDDPHFIQEMLQMGVDGYLNKDEPPEGIRQAVHQAAQKNVRLQFAKSAAISFLFLTQFVFNLLQ